MIRRSAASSSSTSFNSSSARAAASDGDIPNSRVFGLTGETLLNFGWTGVPILHALFGMLIGFVRRNVDALQPGDARFLLVPFAVLLLTALYLLDLSQVVFMFLQDCALLGACFAFALWRPIRPIRALATRSRTFPIIATATRSA